MASSDEKTNRRQLRSSYLTVIVSLSLVLLMLGLLGFILINARDVGNHFKENISVSVYLKEHVKEVEIFKFQKQLEASQYVKTTTYIDRDQAVEIMTKEEGLDFVDFLGYNPLLASIDVRLKAAYVHPDSLAWIVPKLAGNDMVKEVYYLQSLVEKLNENVGKISLFMLFISGILLFIAVVLINNSIRLAIYSKRFLIRSMKLVGATRSFIRRPFIYRGILHGILGSVLAIGMLTGVLLFINDQIPGLVEVRRMEQLLELFAMVMILGVFLSWVCTYFAVGKYIKMKTEKLY